MIGLERCNHGVLLGMVCSDCKLIASSEVAGTPHIKGDGHRTAGGAYETLGAPYNGFINEQVKSLLDRPVSGLKYDDGKLMFSCLTRGLSKPLKELAKIMTFGAKKYARDSWQKVENAEVRYEDALDRHLNDWKNGELNDTESGLPHLAHAAINILFLLHFEINKKPYDRMKDFDGDKELSKEGHADKKEWNYDEASKLYAGLKGADY